MMLFMFIHEIQILAPMIRYEMDDKSWISMELELGLMLASNQSHFPLIVLPA